MDQRCSSSGRVPALQAQSPKFKPQSFLLFPPKKRKYSRKTNTTIKMLEK
jgi:hypothetical protein